MSADKNLTDGQVGIILVTWVIIAGVAAFVAGYKFGYDKAKKEFAPVVEVKWTL